MPARALLFLLLLTLLCPLRAEQAPEVNGFRLLPASALDEKAFAQWIDGAEKPALDGEKPARPQQVFWTNESKFGSDSLHWMGAIYGESKAPGLRHLRIGFNEEVAVGTVFVSGGGKLSVLKQDAAYPGQMDDESSWLPAERLAVGDDATSAKEAAGMEHSVLWVLPPGTKTRALRFSHDAAVTDKSYAMRIGGLLVLPQRLVNLAPQAAVTASVNSAKADRLNNESNDNLWSAWENWDGKEGAAQSPVASSPAWIRLTWPKTVRLQWLASLWTGFGAGEVQVFTGGEKEAIDDAKEDLWQTVWKKEGIENLYPFQFAPLSMDFGKTVATRAVRLRMSAVSNEGHGHLKGSTKNGTRVWLGELYALHDLGQEKLGSVAAKKAIGPESNPPIPVRFMLKEPGLVTLVIEDKDGVRVRNLVSETPYPAGENTAWWDGTDDLGRDPEAARHGLYHIPARPVAPGSYRVRGITRQDINLKYEFSVYNSGNPPWEIEDRTGGWLTNHTPPQAAMFVSGTRHPGGKDLVFLGSYVAEGGHGLAWVDLDGKKQGGLGHVGGHWTGAPFLAVDEGPEAVPGVFGYVASVWTTDQGSGMGELRLTALTKNGERPVLRLEYPLEKTKGKENGEAQPAIEAEMGGIAVRNGIVYGSMRRLNQIFVMDARKTRADSPDKEPSGSLMGKFNCPSPQGLAFDRERLLILSGATLIEQPLGERAGEATGLPAAQVLIGQGLEEPKQLCVDRTWQVGSESKANAPVFYISDWGKSHQVKVFSANGKLLRTIGTAGVPQAGPYDKLHLNHPNGLCQDSRGQLWVTETDFQPKRVSVWDAAGSLQRAFYGPAEYGGGGRLDAHDKNSFDYRGMKFSLDWEKGAFQLEKVLWRMDQTAYSLPGGHSTGASPEGTLRVNGRNYLHNGWSTSPTNGPPMVVIWREEGTAVPAAALGNVHEWELLRTEAYHPRWPAGVNPKGKRHETPVLFAWSDLNGDGQPAPGEVMMEAVRAGGITVQDDLALTATRPGSDARRYAVARFTEKGIPVYDLAKFDSLAAASQSPVTSGGDQCLVHPDGWTVLTVAPKPFAPEGFGGVFQGKPMWSYPSLWPGLHASHESPPPSRPGEVIGSTRLLGGWIKTPVGPLWAVNGNMGNVYLLTADGFFVATLFRDVREGNRWAMPVAQRGMSLNKITLSDENFWPGITQTPDGQVWLVDGGRSSLVRVEGLDTLGRLPDSDLEVTQEQLAEATAWQAAAEAERQKLTGTPAVKIGVFDAKTSLFSQIDGNLAKWKDAEWADVDRRGVAANFNSDSKPYHVRAAAAIAGERLFVAYETADKNLLRNSGETANAPFKNGGGLDLMLATDPQADPNRKQAVAGDLRLFVTMVPKPGEDKAAAQPLALLYRPKASGAQPAERVPFSSPWRTIAFDQVLDVTREVVLATDGKGGYEFSIPLKTLGFAPQSGQTIRADLGVLRGNGFQTTQRVYWSNKATGITADVPSEAELQPSLWGKWIIQ